MSKKSELELALKGMGGVVKVVKDLEDFRPIAVGLNANVEYFETNFDALRAMYPDQWVLIYDRNVISHGTSYRTMLQIIRKRGFDSKIVYIQSTRPENKPVPWILPELSGQILSTVFGR